MTRRAKEVAAGGWQRDLLQHFPPDPNTSLHLAVLVEPYLSLLILGLKTVESRFTTTRRAPWGLVAPGDTLLLKRSAGPIVATATVGHVWSVELTAAAQLAEIRARFNDRIRATPAFWTSCQRAKYATLMEITRVTPIKSVNCDKRDQRGWVTLRTPAQTISGPPRD